MKKLKLPLDKETFEREVFINDEMRNWYESRPKNVKEFIQKYPPCCLYKLRNHVVFLTVYDEELDGKITVTVAITHEFNENVFWDRQVFGVNAEDLRPLCLQSEADQFRTVKPVAVKGDTLFAVRMEGKLIQKIITTVE